jgi:predicted ATP-binding protein involved in virulence
MKIHTLQVKNFKGFADINVVLNDQMTIFIGDNAKGKTSVLDALAVSLGSFLRGIDIAKAEARSIDKSEIRVVTIDGQPRPQLPVEITAYGTVNGKEIKNGWTRTLEKISNKTTTTFVKARNIEKVASDMLAQSRSKGGVTFPVIAYHGTGRLWAEHGEKKAAFKKQEEGVSIAYANCLSPKSSSKEFLSWYKTFEDEVRKFDVENDKVFLEVFNKCIISMMPGDKWQDIAYSFKEDDLIGIFETPNGNKERLLFSQLSDGYRNVIGMVADIAYRCIKLNPHLKENAIKATPGVVLIDELDLHLHPNWQRRIVQDLKNAFPQIQFVATTHSPFIVQSVEQSELINLDNNEWQAVEPDDLPVNKVATEVMGVTSIRSDDFDKRFADAKKQLEEIDNENGSLTTNDYLTISKLLSKVLKQETNDPVFKAYLESQEENEDETN